MKPSVDKKVDKELKKKKMKKEDSLMENPKVAKRK